MTLVFNGMRPERWFKEGKDIGRFDVFAVIRGTPYLIELQLSQLTQREWHNEWKQRVKWLQERKWQDSKWAERFTWTVP